VAARQPRFDAISGSIVNYDVLEISRLRLPLQGTELEFHAFVEFADGYNHAQERIRPPQLRQCGVCG
jgi:hypothetical protein